MSGPPSPATVIEARHGSAGARRAKGGVGGHLGAPSPATVIEARHGSAGARRAKGGFGGHLGAPSPATVIEARHGSAGARRATGGLGAISGPPCPTGITPEGVGRVSGGQRGPLFISSRFTDRARLARLLLCRLGRGDAPRLGTGRSITT